MIPSKLLSLFGIQAISMRRTAQSAVTSAIRQVEKGAEKYLLLISLLFSTQHYHDGPNPVLCKPESYVGHILELYHNSLLELHEGSQGIF